MKFLIFILIINFFNLCVSNKVSTQSSLDSKIIDTCSNSCLSCQNSLYFLKFRGNADCRFNMCPSLCISLSSQWNSGRNTHLNFFKQDQINICETCFRSNYCHINDCLLEKTIVHNAIQHTTENFSFHTLNPNSAVFNMIKMKSEDYFFNMDFVFKNLDKVIRLLTNYEKMYGDSLKLKKFYKIVVKTLSEKYKLSLGGFNLELDVDLDDDVFSKWKDIIVHTKIYKNYYMGLKSDKLNLNDEKIFLSTDIQREEDVITNILDFDNKVKLNLEKANNITELYKMKCHDNLSSLRKFMILVDIISCKYINSEEKTKLITAGVDYTVEQLKFLLAPRKSLPSIKTNNNITKAIDTPRSIIVAGKVIHLGIKPNNKPNIDNFNQISSNRNNTLTEGLLNTKVIEDFSPGDEVNDKIMQNTKEKRIEARIKEPSIGSESSESTKIEIEKKKENIQNVNKNGFLDQNDEGFNNSDREHNPYLQDNKNLYSQEITKLPISSNLNSATNLNILTNSVSSAPNPILQVSLLNKTPISIPTPIPLLTTPTQNVSPGINNSSFPVALSVKAVKIVSPNETFGKNVFRPDAKIDTLAKNILGIDPRPNINHTARKLPITSMTGINSLEQLKKLNNHSVIQNTTQVNYTDSSIESSNSENAHQEQETKPLTVEFTTKSSSSHLALRKEQNEEEDEEDELFSKDDKEDLNSDSEEESFLQEHAKIDSQYEDIDLNMSELKNNKIKKLTVDEIKSSASKFMQSIKDKIEEYRGGEENKTDINKKMSIDDNESLTNFNGNSNNIVDIMSSNLKNLDDEFFQIKHNLIMNLIK